MPGVVCSKCRERFYWTEHYGERVCPKCKLSDRAPAFHVRFIENGVEQEQILVGVSDEQGNISINVPAPCTLLSVKQHGFPYCEVCDGGPTRSLEEIRAELKRRVQPYLQDRIRAEVEAMD